MSILPACCFLDCAIYKVPYCGRLPGKTLDVGPLTVVIGYYIQRHKILGGSSTQARSCDETALTPLLFLHHVHMHLLNGIWEKGTLGSL